jgi:hypothetical protein
MLYVVVYNSLGTNISTIVRLPVSVDATFAIRRVDDHAATIYRATSVACPFAISHPSSAKYVLIFNTGVIPSVGAVVFRIQKVGQQPSHASSSAKRVLSSSVPSRSHQESFDLGGRDEKYFVASNGLGLKVYFDR